MPIDKSMNVLIVDDYATMRRILRNLLDQIGFKNVAEASDGADALTKLRAGTFGMVISDWNMEPMTGLQLLQEVRKDGKLKDMPFIMVTAESKTENVVAAKQAGVNNYIVKPFNAETLQARRSRACSAMADADRLSRAPRGRSARVIPARSPRWWPKSCTPCSRP